VDLRRFYTLGVASTAVRRDLERVKRRDSDWGADQDLLACRIVAVLEARRARRPHERPASGHEMVTNASPQGIT
jgi:hypothetical protein